MRLEIENWAQINLSEDVVEIMNEAVICYKVGAYRSAYLMSYLSFKQTIREKILNAKDKPDKINEDDWKDKVIDVLNNDDTWEDCINNMISTAPDSPKNCLGKVFIFSNREKIKSKYDTWKYTRHSCAHWKTENINEATVVQFWNFMQDNLSEFYVNGGKKYLFNKLCDTYKYFVPEDAEQLDKLLKELSIIYGKGTTILFEELFKEMNNDFKVNDINYKFWERILNSNYDNVRDGLINLINKYNYDIFFKFYKFFPQVFKYIYSLNSKYMQQKICPMLERDYYFEYEECFWSIILRILDTDANIIDINKLTSSYEKLKLIDRIDLEDCDIEKLRKYRVFNLFIQNAGKDFFSNDSYSHSDYYFKNNKSDAYVLECFDYIEWNMDMIKSIESGIYSLEESICMREKDYSKENGRKRKASYLKLVHEHESKIKDVLIKEGKNLADFENISKYL
ncbi:hypothetical protein [Clostridium estertheticum]|uniref:hypothetical protein n=1 Tax=Clostridium estertheticum TaxID=238834 RepID=UPI001CF28C94|nr:hypothetical protein [Clostridium estertheticum]MCB2339951.1 hypothetical protein [Clostridium estertheticum]